jgi:hypothetical protein
VLLLAGRTKAPGSDAINLSAAPTYHSNKLPLCMTLDAFTSSALQELGPSIRASGEI